MTYDYYVALDQERYDLQEIESVTTHYHHLAADGRKKTADELRSTWQAMRLSNQDVPKPALQTQLEMPDFNVDLFPPFTLWLQFPFRLTKAYLSKDERDFYILDNPVRRDKVFRLPYVAPTTWKGNLRAALWKLGHDANHPPVERLFGNERAAEENFRAGRLRFFPTFFKRHGLEIINPHDRERRVGKNPILFESVPPGTPGVFTLLYVPFDRIGKKDKKVTRLQVAEDLQRIAEGVQAMFCTYGFGAKTSSGFGTAVDNFVDKRDQRRYDLPEGHTHLKAVLGQPEAIHIFREKYGRLDEFSSEEWEILLEGNPEMRQAYEAACQAQKRHQYNVQTGQIDEVIESFEEMVSVLKTWATGLSVEASNA
jgi:CRISPR/Cas system CMR subunit Cmr6 (Cas7 group RAMP superfamily)